MPRVPHRVILDDVLRGDGRAVAQTERRRAVEVFVLEGTYGGGRLAAVPGEELERRGFGDVRGGAGMLGVELRDARPRRLDGLAASDGSGGLDLDRIDEGDVMDDDSDGAAVRSADGL